MDSSLPKSVADQDDKGSVMLSASETSTNWILHYVQDDKGSVMLSVSETSTNWILHYVQDDKRFWILRCDQNDKGRGNDRGKGKEEE